MRVGVVVRCRSRQERGPMMLGVDRLQIKVHLIDSERSLAGCEEVFGGEQKANRYEIVAPLRGRLAEVFATTRTRNRTAMSKKVRLA